MTDNRTISTTFVAKLDKSSYNQVTQQLERNQKEQLRLLKAQTAQQQEVLRTADKGSKEYLNALRDQERSLKKIESIHKSLSKEIDSQVAKIDRYNDSFDNVSRNVGLAGDFQSNLGAFQGLTNVAGASGASEAIGIVGEIVVLSEELPRLKASIQGLPEVAKIAADAIGVGGVALTGAIAGLAIGAQIALKQIDDATKNAVRDLEKGLEAEFNLDELIAKGLSSDEIQKVLDEQTRSSEDASRRIAENTKVAKDATNSLANQLGDFVKPAKDLIGVFNPAQKQLSEFEDQFEETFGKEIGFDAALAEVTKALFANQTGFTANAEAIERDNDIVSEATQLQNKFTDAINEGRLATNDAVASVLAKNEAETELFNLQREATNFAKGASTEQLNERISQFEDEANALALQRENLQPLIAESVIAAEKHAELTEQINNLTQKTAIYNTVARDAVQIKELEATAQKRQDELAKTREETDRARESTLNRLISLEDSATKALDSFARKQSELAQDRSLRDLRELEDYQNERAEASRDHQNDLAKIQADGNKRIVDINARIGDLRKDFTKDEIEATKTYNKDVAKLNREYRIEDKQSFQDHLSELRDAEQSNDVISFLKAQQGYQKEQQQKETQRSEEFKQLNDDFAEQKRLRQIAFQERQQDLQRELSQVRMQTDEKLNEARRAFNEEQQLAEQERQIKLQRQRQDDAIADQRSQQALQRQLNEINAKASAEINAIRSVTSAISELQSVANRIASSTGNQTSSSRGGSYLGSTALGAKSYEKTQLAQSKANVLRATYGDRVALSDYNRLGVAFSTGGIVKGGKPQIAMIGDTPSGIDEAIVPFKRSKGLRSALNEYGIMRPQNNNASNITVSVPFSPNVQIGELVSPSEVSQALQSFADTLTNQIEVGLMRAINQTN